MYTIFAILIIITSILLVLVVLVQNPKGGGLSSSFGGSGNQIMGAKKTTDFLEKATLKKRDSFNFIKFIIKLFYS